MKVEVKKSDKLKRTIQVNISGESFIADKKEAFKEAGKNLKVPGFRPGKVPADVLEKHHGKVLKEEFLRNSLPKYYQQAVEKEKLEPVSLPDVYDVEVTDDSLTFKADVEVKPQINVEEKNYKGMKIKSKVAEVKPVEIEKVVTNIKEGIAKVAGKDLADEELAKWSGYADVKSMKEAIKAELTVEKLRARRRDVEGEVTQALLKGIKTDLPKKVVESHHKELVEREVHNLRMRGVPDADLEKYKKEVEDKLKSAAEDEVKLFYILEAIAKKEGIKVDRSVAEVVFGFILSHAQYS